MQEAPASSNQDTTKAEATLQEMQESQPALADVAPEQLSSVTAEDLGSSPEDAQDATAKLEVTQSVAAAAGFADEVTSFPAVAHGAAASGLVSPSFARLLCSCLPFQNILVEARVTDNLDHQSSQFSDCGVSMPSCAQPMLVVDGCDHGLILFGDKSLDAFAMKKIAACDYLLMPEPRPG